MARTLGIQLLFGLPGELPPIPDTWEFVVEHEEFLKARDLETGELFYLTKDTAYPCRQCPPEGMPNSILEPGEWYMEEREPIPLTDT